MPSEHPVLLSDTAAFDMAFPPEGPLQTEALPPLAHQVQEAADPQDDERIPELAWYEEDDLRASERPWRRVLAFHPVFAGLAVAVLLLFGRPQTPLAPTGAAGPSRALGVAPLATDGSQSAPNPAPAISTVPISVSSPRISRKAGAPQRKASKQARFDRD